jgi:zinc transporter 1/2/3
LIGLKLGFLLAVLAAGLLGGALPLRGLAQGRQRFLGWGNAFAAGVFLGAGLIHLLPDADAAWSTLGYGYPAAFGLAGLAFALMLLVEHVLLPESAHEMVHAPAGESFTPTAGLKAYAVLTALSVHSLLAGLALGAEHELNTALVLFAAILAHKSAAGFALGVSLVRSRMPRARAWGLLSLFAVATPLGIAIGTGVGEVLEGRTARLLEASFLSVAAGTFAYVAIVDILRDELSSHQGRFAKWMLFTTGLVAMGVLARWT